MARIYISVGSNIEPEHHVRLALQALQKEYGQLVLSSVYESEAVGFAGDNFLNLVVGLDTDQDVHTVATRLRTIEDENGRTRNGPRFSSRTVDLDLLLYDDLILKEAGLEIPRDEITKNAFVLLPLAEIAPEVLHPEIKQSMSALWQSYDKDAQKLWAIDFNL